MDRAHVRRTLVAAHSTAWFTTSTGGEELSWGTGTSPVVGLVGTCRAAPRVGARAHASFSQTGPPSNGDTRFDVDVNRFLYDVGVAFRPLSRSAQPAVASTYVFAGIGASPAVAGDAERKHVLTPRLGVGLRLHVR